MYLKRPSVRRWRALEALEVVAGTDAAPRGGHNLLFMTHPPLEERIEALRRNYS